MNYGHDVSVSSYNTTQVESDFAYLGSIGVTRIRIVMPEYDDNATLVAHCQDMVTRALSHGFYVVWGVVAGLGAGTLTATRWSAAKTYITGTLAPWAQSAGLSELVLTNESELSADGTTLTASTIRSDIRSMASTIKTNGFTGKVSYNTDVLSATRNPWASEGLGSLDYIGFNSYDIIANFDSRNDLSDFAAGKAYISEFGSTGGGYPDFNNEVLFHHDTVDRITSLQKRSVPSGYFFCYRDGQQGVSPNSFGIIQTNGVAHLALQAILGIATPFYGNFIAHA